MNSFFAAAGRTVANVVDGAVDITRTACKETGDAGSSFATGWKRQRALNSIKQRHGKVIKLKPIRA